MLQTLFGNITTGKLNRLQYLKWFFVLSTLYILAILGFGFGLGIAEHIIGGSVEDAQALLKQNFSWLGIIAVGAVFLAVCFASINISAKRVRDMGLPAWQVVGLVFVASLLISLAGVFAIGLWNLATTLALLFIPSDTFAK